MFTCLAALFDFAKALPASLQTTLHLEGAVSFAGQYLPWFSLNLGWVIPALVGLVLGLVLRTLRKQK